MKTIWLDLTTSYNWKRPPVGVVRVETEIARHFYKKADSSVGYCSYNAATKAYHKLSLAQVAAFLSRNYTKHTSNDSDIYTGELLTFCKDDVYITLGLDWDQKDYAHICSLKREYKFKVITFCYDLIPVLYPQYCVGDVAAKFAKYFVDLAWISDFTFCISKSTENDMRQLLTTLGSPLPDTGVVRLGCDIKNTGNGMISKEVEYFSGSKYILFTSTIERRKNHETIYKAICRLVDDGFEPPHVIFVGMQGWGVGDLMQDIKLDPRVRGRITLLSNLSDDDLAFLYRNCLFTVYPSNYEGWGLPVVECLAHGKFCLASNNSSLPEAGGGFVDYIDAQDILAWTKKIKFYSENDEILHTKEMQIKEKFVLSTWQGTGEMLYERAIKLLQATEKIQNQVVDQSALYIAYTALANNPQHAKPSRK